MATHELNQERVEAFGQRMACILNDGSLALMISIGHRTGLFDAMAGLAPSTSLEIASAAGLNERYVREWLGAMVTGRIVDYEPAEGTYRLPPEHAGLLTRAASTDNLAMFMQYISLFGSVEDGIVESFHRGGGVPYSAYRRFHEVMAEESLLTVGKSLIGTTLPLIPGAIERLESGIDVLDVGCGCGYAINLMAETFPRSRFTGYDFSETGIGNARAEAGRLGLTNARFEVKDVAKVDVHAEYDLITAFDAIHDQAQPTKVLKCIAEALRPDGTFLMQDIRGSSFVERNIGHPLAPMLYTASCMHCMTVSLALDGEGLGAMWGEEKALQMLAEAGFVRVEVKQVPADIQNNYYLARKS